MSCPVSVYCAICPVSVYCDGVGPVSVYCAICPVSVYCDGAGYHVLCLFTVTGWGVMSCVCIL